MKIGRHLTGELGRFAVLLAATTMGTGCSAESGSKQSADPGEIKEGLVLSEADAKSGRLAGSFAQGGRVIYFEAERGEENPRPAMNELDLPRFSVDARFMDAAGKTFILSGGGGEVARPDWDPEADDSDPEERTKDLALVVKFADELTLLGAMPGLDYELEKLAQLAEELRGMDLVVKPSGDVPYACTPGYEHDMTIRYKAAFDLPIGNHSAVRLDSWYLNTFCTWVYQGYQESCNDGTCATALSMADLCYWNSPIRSTKWPAFQVYTAYENGSCSSFYNPWSTLGGHNCNDDTYFQGYNIRNNAYYLAASGPSGICTDGTTHSYAPNCTGGRGAP
jgi:hypothetical protein